MLQILTFHCRVTETFHTAILVAFIYITSVTDYGELLKLDDAHWSGKWSVAIASLNISIIQVNVNSTSGSFELQLTSTISRSSPGVYDAFRDDGLFLYFPGLVPLSGSEVQSP